MLIEPCQPLFERDFVPLPVAVGDVDLQPVCSTLSQFFSFAEFEQRSSDVIRLRVDVLRHRIRPAAMIQLIRKIDPLLGELPLRQGEAQGHDLLESSKLLAGVCFQSKKHTRVPGAPHGFVHNLINTVIRILQRVDGG